MIRGKLVTLNSWKNKWIKFSAYIMKWATSKSKEWKRDGKMYLAYIEKILTFFKKWRREGT